MPEPGAPAESPLGKLLLLQSALPVAPDARRLGEMVAHGLASVAGVAGAAVCLEGRLLASTLSPGQVSCAAREGPGRCGARCPRASEPGVLWVDLRAARHAYGAVVLGVGPAGLDRLLEAAVRNTVNLAALKLESDGQAVALASLNQALADQVRQRTAQLETEKERLAVTLASIGDAVIATDAAGRVTLLNPVAERLTGWSSGDARGHLLEEVLVLRASGSDAPVPGPVRSLLEGRAAVALPSDALLRARDGAERPVADSAAAIRGPDGGLLGAVLVLRDCTEERRAQEQLRQSQKLESLGRMAGGVAHDFNNLLTVILGCTEELRSRPELAGPACQLEVDQLALAGSRAQDLTRQLLTFARMGAASPRQLAVDEVIADSAGLLRRLLGEGVSLDAPPSPGLPSVRLDRSQLEQVLMNLAVNARDAMPAGGRLEVRSRVERLDPAEAARHPDARPGSWVVLSVRDTGTGLSPEVRRHLFEPFFTTKPPGEGTGLGLATVHGIVHQAGGHLRVESAEGLGATFEVWLPAASPGPGDSERKG